MQEMQGAGKKGRSAEGAGTKGLASGLEPVLASQKQDQPRVGPHLGPNQRGRQTHQCRQRLRAWTQPRQIDGGFGRSRSFHLKCSSSEKFVVSSSYVVAKTMPAAP